MDEITCLLLGLSHVHVNYFFTLEVIGSNKLLVGYLQSLLVVCNG
jgi:hypothetical protein